MWNKKNVQTKLLCPHKFRISKLNRFEWNECCAVLFFCCCVFLGSFLSHTLSTVVCSLFLLSGTLFTIMTLRLRIPRQFWFIIRHIRYRQNDVYAFCPNKMELTFRYSVVYRSTNTRASSKRYTRMISVAVLRYSNFDVGFCEAEYNHFGTNFNFAHEFQKRMKLVLRPWFLW